MRKRQIKKMDLKKYCERKGCYLLKDDVMFLRSMLANINVIDRLNVLDKYIEKFKDGIESEDNAHKKQNVGRKEASTWLLDNIKNWIDR
jgi:hypothetical protein